MIRAWTGVLSNDGKTSRSARVSRSRRRARPKVSSSPLSERVRLQGGLAPSGNFGVLFREVRETFGRHTAGSRKTLAERSFALCQKYKPPVICRRFVLFH